MPIVHLVWKGVAGLVLALLLDKRIGYAGEAMFPSSAALALRFCGSVASDLTQAAHLPLTE
jgi:ammonia channel protein AmtB